MQIVFNTQAFQQQALNPQYGNLKIWWHFDILSMSGSALAGALPKCSGTRQKRTDGRSVSPWGAGGLSTPVRWTLSAVRFYSRLSFQLSVILSLFISIILVAEELKTPAVVWGVWDKSSWSRRTYRWVRFLNQLGFLTHIFFCRLLAAQHWLVGT